MKSRQLIVRTGAQTRRLRVAAVLAAAALPFAGWGLYALGRANVPGPFELGAGVVAASGSVADELGGPRARLRALGLENEKLAQQVVAQKRAIDIDAATSKALRDSIQAMQAQIAALKRDVAFYRGIVSPEDAQAGLRVQSLRVLASGDPQAFLLHLILIQAVRHDEEISGDVRIRLKGLLGGEPVSIPWSKLTLQGSPELAFSFQYFQELGGSFRIPPDVQPTMLEVRVRPSEGAAITRTYHWQEIMRAPG